MNETRQLAHFVAATCFEDLHPELIERFKVYVLDNIASGFIGSVQPSSTIIAEMVRESGAQGLCTVFGNAWRAGLSGAALVNGAMVGGFETDHGSNTASGHPSSTVFPAAMAVAEHEHSDGKSFLTALVLGYEVLCRVGEAATRAVEDERGFHGPGTNGQFGAAVAVGKLLGFDEGKLTNALGIAGSHSAGLMEFVWEGAMTKRLHLGRAAQTGLDSALLAAKGFTGPSTVLEGKHGFFNVFSPSPKPEKLLADIGNDWLAQRLLIKPYACHGSHLSIAQGLDHFKAHHPLSARDVRKVTVASGNFMVHKHADSEPKTVSGAQYSVVFGVAIALAKDISDPYVYNEETLWDKDVRALAKRVEAVVDPRFKDARTMNPQAEVIIEMNSGERHVIAIDGFKGLPGTPFNFDDACGKLRRCVAPMIDKQQTDAIIEKVRKLEQLGDMAELAKLMGK